MTEFPGNEAAAALFGVHVGGLGMDRVGAATGPLLDDGPLVAAPFFSDCADEAHDVGLGTDSIAGRADGMLATDVTSGFTAADASAAGTHTLAPTRGTARPSADGGRCPTEAGDDDWAFVTLGLAFVPCLLALSFSVTLLAFR